jgi:hypothetical protein
LDEFGQSKSCPKSPEKAEIGKVESRNQGVTDLNRRERSLFQRGIRQKDLRQKDEYEDVTESWGNDWGIDLVVYVAQPSEGKARDEIGLQFSVYLGR